MIDENFKVYLIEVNTNPCLEISCNLLNKIIPPMIENSIRLIKILKFRNLLIITYSS